MRHLARQHDDHSALGSVVATIHHIGIGGDVGTQNHHLLGFLRTGVGVPIVDTQPDRHRRITRCAGGEPVQREVVPHIRRAVLATAIQKHVAHIVREQLGHGDEDALVLGLGDDPVSEEAPVHGGRVRGRQHRGSPHMALHEVLHGSRERERAHHALSVLREGAQDLLHGVQAVEDLDPIRLVEDDNLDRCQRHVPPASSGEDRARSAHQNARPARKGPGRAERRDRLSHACRKTSQRLRQTVRSLGRGGQDQEAGTSGGVRQPLERSCRPRDHRARPGSGAQDDVVPAPHDGDGGLLEGGRALDAFGCEHLHQFGKNV